MEMNIHTKKGLAMRRWGWMVSVATMVVMLAVTAGRAAPLQFDRVGETARWVAHIDIERLKSTQLGQYVLGELDKAEPNRKFLAFQAIVGVDPRKDLASVTMYGPDNQPSNTVTLFRGTLDVQKIETLVRAATEYQEMNHNGHTIHSWVDTGHGNRRMFASVLADGTVVFGSDAALRQALDVVDGRAPKAAALAFPGLTAASQTPIFLASADLQNMGNLNPQAAVLAQASSAFVTLSEAGEQVAIRIGLQAKTPEAATQIESVARGLAAMAALNEAQNPEMAKLSASTSITRDETRVDVSIKYPVADAIAGLKQMSKQVKQGNGSRGTRAGQQPPSP